jgi:hypothetical protein
MTKEAEMRELYPKPSMVAYKQPPNLFFFFFFYVNPWSIAQLPKDQLPPA